MESHDLLAEIVKRFAPRQWENVATETLAYLLHRPGGERGLLAQFDALGTPFPAGLTWTTQNRGAEDSGIPDLVGLDRADRAAVIIEVKFAAGLTSNQPTTYLERQEREFRTDPDADRVVAFVAPDWRSESLARELARRAGAELDLARATPLLRLHGRVGLVVLPWASVLSALDRSFREVGDAEGLAALGQLVGMCDRADKEQMLPLGPDEVGSDRGRRVLEFHDLLDKLADRVESHGVAVRLGRSSKRGSYSWRFSTASGATFRIRLDFGRWARVHPTPLWLRFSRTSPEFRVALRRMAAAGEAPVVHITDSRAYVALDLPIGVPADEMLEQLTQAVSGVLRIMPSGGSTDTAEDDETAEE